jgi:hypothetical protein
MRAPVFAVAGTWPVDELIDAEQLAHIAETVRTMGGFVQGFWGQEPSDVTRAHAFVVLQDEASANAMARAVREAIPAASVTVLKVLATA